MRQQYLDLHAVGGLTLQTSSLYIVQRLKENQERLSESLKLEFQNGIRETINLINQENISPNGNPCQQSYYHPFVNPEESGMQNPPTDNMLATNQGSYNEMITKLLQVIQVMQH